MSLPPSEATLRQGDTASWAFVQALKRLVQQRDLGALAALRQGLGRPAAATAAMYPYVVPYLPPRRPGSSAADEQDEEDAYFLIAALFAWHPMDWTPSEAEAEGDATFGASFRRLAWTMDRESIERRFVALLDARREDLPEQLRHAIGLLKSKAIPVNWVRLLRDVLHWERCDRGVQLAWARSYWRPRPPIQVSSQARGANAAGGQSAGADQIEASEASREE